jgi:orotate phosphoribosyltransferase
MNVNETSAKIAQSLLACEAVKLNVSNPFTWTSGLRSPVYCDNRVTLSFTETRKYITQSLCDAITAHFGEVEAIVGVATAGIPQGTSIADALNLPFAYVRSEAKKHGLKNNIEGKIAPNTNVVVVEDLISTGKSSLKAVEDLRENGVNVIGLVSIFNYGFKDTDSKFKLANCPYISLSNFSDLLEEAVKIGYIKSEEIEKISNWSLDPVAWSEQFEQNK